MIVICPPSLLPNLHEIFPFIAEFQVEICFNLPQFCRWVTKEILCAERILSLFSK